MHLHESFLLALAAMPAAHASLYSKSSPVLQVDAKSYDTLIAKSNHTSIVEFYAPWCGHCKNLAPAYAKAATSLAGLANVAAVNCDEDANKPFCGRMGVQGFPTLKIVKPGKKKGKPSVRDYQGQREAKDIIAAVKEQMPNHVTRVKDDNHESWLTTNDARPKALIFGDKGLVPPLAKALAVDFLGSIDVGYSRASDKDTAAKYAVQTYPSVILVQQGSEPQTYSGEVNKAGLLEFLSQAASPNPDATRSTASAPKAKKPAKKAKSKSAKSDSKEDPASCPHAAGKDATHNPHEKLDDEDPLESPSPDASEGNAKPAAVPVEPTPKLHVLESESALQKSCLSSVSSTCVLAVVPDAETEGTVATALSAIAQKHASRGAKIFPFYAVSASNEGAQTLLKGLKLADASSGTQVLAVNAKRSWYSTFDGESPESVALEKWVDGIRFGEVKKLTLPENVVSQVQKEAEKEDEKIVEEIESEEPEVVEHGEL